jgi:hypothetical protein
LRPEVDDDRHTMPGDTLGVALDDWLSPTPDPRPIPALRLAGTRRAKATIERFLADPLGFQRSGDAGL